MLSGQCAFRGDTGIDVVTAILQQDPPDLPVADRHIPLALARIVARCLEKNPSARFHSADDLAFALEALSTPSGQVSTTDAVAAADRGIRRQRGGYTWAAVAIVLLLALAGTLPFAIAHLREKPAEVSAVTFSLDFAPDTILTAAQTFPTVSPDGRSIVFSAPGAGGQRMLWVRPIDSVAVRMLQGTEAAFAPFWAPDNRSVGFFAQDKLKKIDIAGGAPQTVADAPRAFGGTWSRDDAIVFGSIGGGLWQVSAAGGQPAAVTTLDGTRNERGHVLPEFLPDGRGFLFLAIPENAIHAGTIGSPDTTRLVASDSQSRYAPPGYLLFVRDGRLMAQAFDASRAEASGDAVPIAEDVGVPSRAGIISSGYASFGISDSGVLVYRTGLTERRRVLRWFDRTGAPLGLLGTEGAYADIERSPDGTRLAVSATREEEHRHLDLRRRTGRANSSDVGPRGGHWSQVIAERRAGRLRASAGAEARPLRERRERHGTRGDARRIRSDALSRQLVSSHAALRVRRPQDDVGSVESVGGRSHGGTVHPDGTKPGVHPVLTGREVGGVPVERERAGRDLRRAGAAAQQQDFALDRRRRCSALAA